MPAKSTPPAERFREIQFPGEIDTTQWFDFWVTRMGPAAAAWLVRQGRLRLRQHGVYRFHITLKQGAREPAWFLVAVETLRRRRGWTVARRTEPANRHAPEGLGAVVVFYALKFERRVFS